MLNACALNSRPLDSRIANRLPRPKSKLTNPGPRTAPFDSFPKVPGVGYTKALVLNHCVRVFGPLALAIWLARSGPQQGTPSLSVAKVTVAGKPFCISVIPDTCHPPSAVFIAPGLPRNAEIGRASCRERLE